MRGFGEKNSPDRRSATIFLRNPQLFSLFSPNKMNALQSKFRQQFPSPSRWKLSPPPHEYSPTSPSTPAKPPDPSKHSMRALRPQTVDTRKCHRTAYPNSCIAGSKPRVRVRMRWRCRLASTPLQPHAEDPSAVSHEKVKATE